MTVSSPLSRVVYSGDGASTVFVVPFPFLADADLKVVLAEPGGIERALRLGQDYAAVGAGQPTGGSVRLAAAPAAGETVAVLRDIAFVQETDFEENASLPADTLERAFDRLTMAIQQLSDLARRTIRLAPTDPTTGLTLPPVAERGNRYLGFDAAGQLVPAAAPEGGNVVSTFMAPLLGAATAADALARLELVAKDAGTLQQDGVPVMLTGKHTVGVGAGGMVPAITRGCAPALQAETEANKVAYKYLAFDQASIEYAHFDFPSPKSWDAGALTFMVHWTHPDATAYGVVWTLELLALGDGEVLDAAYGAGVDVADTGGTAGALYASAESAAVAPRARRPRGTASSAASRARRPTPPTPWTPTPT